MTTEIESLERDQARDKAAEDQAATEYDQARPDDRAGTQAPSLGADGVDIPAGDDDPADQSQEGRTGPSAARHRPRMASLTSDTGDGYLVRRVSSPDHLIEVCRVCGEALPLPSDPCEFADQAEHVAARRYRAQVEGLPVRHVLSYGSPGKRTDLRGDIGDMLAPRDACPVEVSFVPTQTVVPGNAAGDFRCRCNGCETKRRKPGNQPEFCSRECEREGKRLQKARERARKRAEEIETASAWIAENPEFDDKALADASGIPRARFREARQKSPSLQ